MAASASCAEAEAFFDTSAAIARAEIATQGALTAESAAQLLADFKKACNRLDDERAARAEERTAKENAENRFKQLVDNPPTTEHHCAIKDYSREARHVFTDNLEFLRNTWDEANDQSLSASERSQAAETVWELLDESTGQVQREYNKVVERMQTEIDDQRQRTAIYRERLRELVRQRNDADARVNNAEAYAQEMVEDGVTPANIGVVVGEIRAAIEDAIQQLRVITTQINVPLTPTQPEDDSDDDLRKSVVNRDQREPLLGFAILINTFREMVKILQENIQNRNQETGSDEDLLARGNSKENAARIQGLEEQFTQVEHAREFAQLQKKGYEDGYKVKDREIQKLHANRKILRREQAVGNFNSKRQTSGLTEEGAVSLLHCVERLIKNGKSLRKIIEQVGKDPADQVRGLQAKLNVTNQKCAHEHVNDQQEINDLEKKTDQLQKDLSAARVRIKSYENALHRERRVIESSGGDRELVIVNQELQDTVEGLKEEKTVLEKKVEDLRSQNASSPGQESNLVEDLRYDGLAMADVIKLFENEIQAHIHENSILEKRAGDLERKVKKLRVRNRALKKQIDNADTNFSIRAKTDDIDPIHTEKRGIERQEEKAKILQEKDDTLAEQVEVAVRRQTEAFEERADFAAQLGAISSRNDRALGSKEKAELEEKIRELTRKLKDAEAEIGQINVEGTIKFLETHCNRLLQDHQEEFMDETGKEDEALDMQIFAFNKLIKFLNSPGHGNEAIGHSLVSLVENWQSVRSKCKLSIQKLESEAEVYKEIIGNARAVQSDEVIAQIDRLLQGSDKELQNQVSLQRQELDDLKEAKRTELAGLEQKLKETSQALSHTLFDNNESVRVNVELNKNLLALNQKEIHCLHAQDQLTAKVKEPIAQLKRIEKAKDNETVELTDRVTALEEWEDEAHRDGADYNATLNEKAKEARDEAKQLRSQLTEADAKIKDYVSQFTIQNPTYEEQTRTIAGLNNEISREQTANRTQFEQITTLNQRVTELEGEIVGWVERGGRAGAPEPRTPRGPPSPPQSRRRPPPVRPGAGRTSSNSSSSLGIQGLFDRHGSGHGGTGFPSIDDDPFTGGGGGGAIDFGGSNDDGDLLGDDDDDDEATQNLKRQVRDLQDQIQALERQNQIQIDRIEALGEGGDAGLAADIAVLQTRIGELEEQLQQCRAETWQDRKRRVTRENRAAALARGPRPPKRKREDPALTQQKDWTDGGWRGKHFEPPAKRGEPPSTPYGR